MKQCEKWESKPLHGQYIRQINKADVDKQRTHSWLKGTGLKSETEGLIIAAQDQTLPTRYYENKIMGKDVNTKCRICGDYDDTVDHIISGCPVLVHWKLCKQYGFTVCIKWYEHEPEKVMDNDTATILCDMQVHTDRTITANRPDIIVKNKVE
ncbi:uncharacterized protein LOC116299153 [Actinia tenebrosa]|uniref:Uncharacterized protein LOC116299153 n=1 Tax=Actinia tenebrosa TaxID=6105 RepID=A0A6P8I516_ACTTE|nr:uncharacterized protein LOC116299153 [Actinia tenebrosa]